MVGLNTVSGLNGVGTGVGIGVGVGTGVGVTVGIGVGVGVTVGTGVGLGMGVGVGVTVGKGIGVGVGVTVGTGVGVVVGVGDAVGAGGIGAGALVYVFEVKLLPPPPLHPVIRATTMINITVDTKLFSRFLTKSLLGVFYASSLLGRIFKEQIVLNFLSRL